MDATYRIKEYWNKHHDIPEYRLEKVVVSPSVGVRRSIETILFSLSEMVIRDWALDNDITIDRFVCQDGSIY